MRRQFVIFSLLLKRARTQMPLILPESGLTCRRGFTLVEVLVAITIIGILASFITVSAMGALKHSRRSEIKQEIDRLDTAFELLKSRYGEYPPNLQNALPIDATGTYKNFKRYLNLIAPRHREPDDLLWIIIGVWVPDQQHFPKAHNGGVTAAEDIVFWLGGFSDDPNYPISGKGGPSYIVAKHDDPINRTLDPIESRTSVFPFDVDRLGPRAPDSYFEEGEYNHIEYFLNGQWHRMNFWRYSPRKSDQAYNYFDVSRGSPTLQTDVPGTNGSGQDSPWIYPLKKVDKRDASGSRLSFKFVNQGRFQILHCGLDNNWGDPLRQLYRGNDPEHIPYPGPEKQNFMRLDIDNDGKITPAELNGVIVYPEGPYDGDLADTQTNISTESTLEEAKP
jgi:prepilin-type N-terminal cleavage/methylation domain-containing protein